MPAYSYTAITDTGIKKKGILSANSEREARSEEEAKALINSIKADSDIKMGIITDIKQELRKAQSYKINYSTKRGEPAANLN